MHSMQTTMSSRYQTRELQRNVVVGDANHHFTQLLRVNQLLDLAINCSRSLQYTFSYISYAIQKQSDRYLITLLHYHFFWKSSKNLKST